MDTAGSGHLATVLDLQAALLSMQEEQLSSLSQGMSSLAHRQDGFTATMTAQLGNLSNQIQQLVGATQAERPEPSTPESSPVPTLAHGGPGLRLAPPRVMLGGDRTL